MRGSDWTKQEVELVISQYFEMLKLHLMGISFSKTKYRKIVMPLLNKRSDKSIDYKHCNISAVLVQLGRTYIPGYKPYWNYQGLLRDVILERIKELENLDSLMENYSKQEVTVNVQKVSYDKWLIETPEPSKIFKEPSTDYKTVKRNFIEEEQRNKSIGQSGEELVFNYELWRLEQLGKYSLKKKVEWVSKDQGDGAGFDILSKNSDGTDRFIEVKTTTLGKETPIFFTKRENDFSEINPDQFHLYRVFQLKRRPKMFQCKGAFSSFGMNIEPISFKGRF